MLYNTITQLPIIGIKMAGRNRKQTGSQKPVLHEKKLKNETVTKLKPKSSKLIFNFYYKLVITIYNCWCINFVLIIYL